MGSTYLELTNQVLRSLNEVELTSSTFPSARGIHAKAKDAVLAAVRRINTQKFEWPFNATAGSQLLVIGQNIYTWPADLRWGDMDSFSVVKNPTLGNLTTNLENISKDQWYRTTKPIDDDAGSVGRSIPLAVFQTDSGGFGVTPSPDKAYTVHYRYFIKTINLSVYSDVCTIPSEYDYVIHSGSMYYMYMFLDNDSRSGIVSQEFVANLDAMKYVLIPKDPRVYSSVVNFGGGIGNNTSGWYWR